MSSVRRPHGHVADWSIVSNIFCYRYIGIITLYYCRIFEVVKSLKCFFVHHIYLVDLPHKFQFNCFIPSCLPCDDVDIDECAADNGGCSAAADCINTPGSYSCTCLPGYSGDGYMCEGKSD